MAERRIGGTSSMETKAIEKQPKIYFYIVIAVYLFEYIRPQATIGFLKYLSIPGILSLLAAYVFIKSNKEYFYKDPLIRLSAAFLFLCAFSVIFVVNHSAWLSSTSNIFLILFVFVFPLVLVVNSFERIIKFFNIWLISFICLFAYLFFHKGMGPGSFLYDENDVAMTLCVGLSYAYYISCAPCSTGYKKWLYRAIAVLCIIGVVLTSSRGGFLGMLAVFFCIWWQTKSKVKIAFICLLLSLAALPFVYKALPQGYVDDMKSISDTTDNTRNERLRSWKYGLYMFMGNPVLGVGAGNYPWAVHEYHIEDDYMVKKKMLGGRQSHSLWFTLIPELGLVGIVIYFSMIIILFKRLSRMKEMLEPAMEKGEENLQTLNYLVKATYAATVSFFVSATFVSVLYYPVFWQLMGFTVVLYRQCINDVSVGSFFAHKKMKVNQV